MMLGNMLPAITGSQSHDVLPCYSMLPRNFSVVFFRRFNLPHLATGKPRISMPLASRYPSFFDRILGVLFHCPKAEMLRVHTRGVVA